MNPLAQRVARLEAIVRLLQGLDRCYYGYEAEAILQKIRNA